MMLLVPEDIAFCIGAHEYLIDPVGEGNFSVDSGRSQCSHIDTTIILAKLEMHLDQESVHDFRRLQSLCQALMRGLPTDPEVWAPHSLGSAPLNDFLRLFRLESPKAWVGPTTPVLLAADSDLDVTQMSPKCRASVCEEERRNEGASLVLTAPALSHWPRGRAMRAWSRSCWTTARRCRRRHTWAPRGWWQPPRPAAFLAPWRSSHAGPMPIFAPKWASGPWRSRWRCRGRRGAHLVGRARLGGGVALGPPRGLQPSALLGHLRRRRCLRSPNRRREGVSGCGRARHLGPQGGARRALERQLPLRL